MVVLLWHGNVWQPLQLMHPDKMLPLLYLFPLLDLCHPFIQPHIEIPASADGDIYTHAYTPTHTIQHHSPPLLLLFTSHHDDNVWPKPIELEHHHVRLPDEVIQQLSASLRRLSDLLGPKFRTLHYPHPT